MFVEEEVTGGSVEIKIHTRVHSIDKTVDLCDLAKDAGLSCPIAAGITTFSVTQGVPSVSILKVSYIYMCIHSVYTVKFSSSKFHHFVLFVRPLHMTKFKPPKFLFIIDLSYPYA